MGPCSTGWSPRSTRRGMTRAAHAHRAGAEVGDEAQEGQGQATRARSCSASGRAPSRPATATAWTSGRSGTSRTTREFLGPAVQGRQAAHAAALPQALRRRRARDPRRRAATRATRCCSARPRRSATTNVVSPLAFLRGALCLNRGLQGQAELQEAADRRLRAPRLHAQGGPDVRLRRQGRGEHRLARPADRGARQGGARRARSTANRGIYLTEFGIQSRPDPLAGVKLARQAEYTAISEKIAYANPRVKAFSQYLHARRSAARQGRSQRYSGFESGLRTSKGKRKPAYNAFMLPLVATQYGSRDVLWGRVRPATGPTQVVIEHKIGNGQVEAADRAADRRRLRLRHAAPQQAPLPREVDAARRRRRSPVRRSGAYWTRSDVSDIHV